MVSAGAAPAAMTALTVGSVVAVTAVTGLLAYSAYVVLSPPDVAAPAAETLLTGPVDDGFSPVTVPPAPPPPPTTSVTGGEPDLVITELRLEPAETRPGQSVRFIATVANLGDGTTAVPFDITFTVDGELQTLRSISPVLPGKGLEVMSATWAADAGDHVVNVTADSGGDIVESDEGNNGLTVAFTVAR